MTDRAVVSPDGRLYATLRPGAAGRPMLVCIHGGGCDGTYFDLPGFSVVAAAAARGFSVLLVDRPGHGASPPPLTPAPIDEVAVLLPALVVAARATLPLPSGPTVVLGHSIGAAVALRLAAGNTLPLAGVAVSGLGDRASDEAAAWLGRVERGEAGHEPSGDFFFGPEEEVARRRVPVFFRLAEHERIWRNDAAALARIAAAFPHATPVDAAILPEGGHLYEIHRRGPEFVGAMLDFADRAGATWLARGGLNV